MAEIECISKSLVRRMRRENRECRVEKVSETQLLLYDITEWTSKDVSNMYYLFPNVVYEVFHSETSVSGLAVRFRLMWLNRNFFSSGIFVTVGILALAYLTYYLIKFTEWNVPLMTNTTQNVSEPKL